jgi:hypothetical protein
MSNPLVAKRLVIGAAKGGDQAFDLANQERAN